MSNHFSDQIREAIAGNRIAVVVGAGVTMGAMNGIKSYSWKSLLERGLQVCKDSYHKDQHWLQTKMKELDAADMHTLLAIAYEVEIRLKESMQTYTNWLHDEFKNLKPVYMDVLDRITRIAHAGNVIATTNYDNLLTDSSGRQPVTWLDPEELRNALTGVSNKVIHLHGHYEKPESIVFGANSYNKILFNEIAQQAQQLLTSKFQMIFMGYGAGMGDPNFRNLLNLLRTTFHRFSGQHFLLAREGDIGRPEMDQLRNSNVQVLYYGKNYKELPAFLDSILVHTTPVPKSPIPFSGELPENLKNPIGRKEEIDQILELLSKPEVKVITLHGISGIGKTLLACHVANKLKEAGNKICYVQLVSVEDYKLVPTEIAAAVGFPAAKGIDELINYLIDKDFLIVIDHFERLLKASEYINKLTTTCKDLTFLITSQIRLNVESEHIVEVEGLKWPRSSVESGDLKGMIEEFPSIKMFVERAKQSDRKFAETDDNIRDVAKICRLIDGIPLAIEIIAPYTKSFSLKQIAQRINAGGFEKVENTLEWCYNNLPEEEKLLFRILSIFEGSFDHHLAEKLCLALEINLDVFVLLRSLMDKSLVYVQEQTYLEGGYRYAILETVRRFGLKKNSSEELNKLKSEHAKLLLQIVDHAEPKLTSSERETGNWLERIDFEYENLRSVLEWCRDGNGPACESGIGIAAKLFWYWNLRCRFREGFEWTKQLLERSNETGLIRAQAYYTLGGLAFLESYYKEAYEWLQESVNILEAEPGTKQQQRQLGFSLIILGVLQLNYNPHQLEFAETALNRSRNIFESIKDEWGIALSLNDLGRIAMAQQQYERGLEYYNRSLKLWRKLKDPWGESLTLGCKGELLLLSGDPDKSLECLKAALKLQKKEDKWGSAIIDKEMAKVYLTKKEYYQAAECFASSLTKHSELNRQQLIAECMEGISKLCLETGEILQGIVIFSASEELRINIHAPNESIQQEIKNIILEKADLSAAEMESAINDGKFDETAKAIIYSLSTCDTIKKKYNQPVQVQAQVGV